MGRHSAAADDEGDDLAVGQSSVAVVEHDDRPAGRHAARGTPSTPNAAPPAVVPAAVARADTARIPLITDPIVDQPIPESETVLIPVITAPLLDEPGPVPAPAATGMVTAGPAPKASGHATAADIALIRGHGDVRARALAAVLVPFVGYVVYWLVVGGATTRSWLIWIWIPVIAAGVLFGVTLDLGHKRYGPPAR